MMPRRRRSVKIAIAILLAISTMLAETTIMALAMIWADQFILLMSVGGLIALLAFAAGYFLLKEVRENLRPA